MKLKDILTAAKHDTKICITIVSKTELSRQEYINLNNPLPPKALLEMDSVVEILDADIDFIQSSFHSDLESNCIYPTLEIFVYSK